MTLRDNSNNTRIYIFMARKVRMLIMIHREDLFKPIKGFKLKKRSLIQKETS